MRAWPPQTWGEGWYALWLCNLPQQPVPAAWPASLRQACLPIWASTRAVCGPCMHIPSLACWAGQVIGLE